MREPIGLSFKELTNLKTQSEALFRIQITNQKPSEAGFDLRGETTEQVSIRACMNTGFAEWISTRSS